LQDEPASGYGSSSATTRAPFQYGGNWVYDEAKGLHVTSTFHPAEACLHAKLLSPDDYRLEVRTQQHGTHERTSARFVSGRARSSTLSWIYASSTRAPGPNTATARAGQGSESGEIFTGSRQVP
jgi:hypothetical protein